RAFFLRGVATLAALLELFALLRRHGLEALLHLLALRRIGLAIRRALAIGSRSARRAREAGLDDVHFHAFADAVDAIGHDALAGLEPLLDRGIEPLGGTGGHGTDRHGAVVLHDIDHDGP